MIKKVEKILNTKQIPLNYNRLKDKSILITGATGFVGKNLAGRLKALGANVYGISQKDLEITDFSALKRFLKDKRITICFHLAGEALVETGQKQPYKTFYTNFLGTLNVLELARLYNLERIIIASTSHVYGENKVPYLESYPPKPTRPYETSKTCADLIAQSYADTFNLPLIIPRFVNIYGPGDTSFSRLIPRTIRSVIDGREPEMWGGDALRQYLFIDDAINAYLDLASVKIENVGRSRIFNFGSREKISVKDLISLVIDISGKKMKIKHTQDLRQSEIKSQYVSSKRAKEVLGWTSKISLREGIIRSFFWYEKNKAIFPQA